MKEEVENLLNLMEHYSSNNDNDNDMVGQEIAPFFYPEADQGFYIKVYNSDDTYHVISHEEFYSHQLGGELEIPDLLKEVLAGIFLVGSTIINPELLIPLGLATAIGVVGEILHDTNDEDSLEYKIGSFLFKLNKVMLFSTATIAFGNYYTGQLGRILGIMSASLFNVSYNILEEDLRFRIIDPERYEHLSGFDPHSCVDYDKSSVDFQALIAKTSQKGMMSTLKILLKTEMNELFDSIFNTSLPSPVGLIIQELVMPFIYNSITTIIETWISNNFRNMQENALKDSIAVFSKTTTKFLTEQAITEINDPIIGNYLPAITANTISMIVRSFLNDYWHQSTIDEMEEIVE